MTLELGLALGTLVFTVLGFLVTIAAFVFALGKRDAKIDELERRQVEDRQNNKEQHKEFDKAKYIAESTASSVSRVDIDLREVKKDIKTILERLPKNEG
jgi:Tfp pilus assembly protein PilO